MEFAHLARKPRRPRSHVIGDVGRTFVKLLLEKWGWTADIVHSDYGEDLDCTVLTGGRRTALGSVPSSGGNSAAAFVSSPTPT